MLNQPIVTSAAAGARQPVVGSRIALAKPPQFHIINKLTLIGYLGNDAEVRTNNDRSLTTFSLATQSSYKKDGKYINHTEWTRCVVFGKLGEYAASLKKGAHIYVEGEKRTREYESKKTGKTESVTELRVSVIRNLDRTAKAAPEEQEIDEVSIDEEAA
jgi:single-strand DNA-binding protein